MVACGTNKFVVQPELDRDLRVPRADACVPAMVEGGGVMQEAHYFVVRRNDDWIVESDRDQQGPYNPCKSQAEAVRFAIDAAEKLKRHGERAQIVLIGPTWTY